MHPVDPNLPDRTVSARDVFNIDTDLQVPAFSVVDEQVAARLNWPCVRVNLDGHVTRMDLVGKDAIVLREGRQVTEFQEGILTWALQRPCALVFDEYDVGRADVMFVIQRVLEVEGRLTLLDQSRVIEPHPASRLFATANTIGLGDATGLYHGTQPLNQGQMDRWNIAVTLNDLSQDQEMNVVLSRRGFADGDLSTVMSPRAVVTWAENMTLFHNIALALPARRTPRGASARRAAGGRPLRLAPAGQARWRAGASVGRGPLSREPLPPQCP